MLQLKMEYKQSFFFQKKNIKLLLANHYLLCILNDGYIEGFFWECNRKKNNLSDKSFQV